MRYVFVALALAMTMQTAMADSVLIFGASRNTGLEAAKILVARGDAVSAFVRESSNVDALNALDVHLITGDALDAGSVVDAFADRSFDAVVTTLSGSIRDTTVDSQGNINVFAAAENAGVRRMIFVTAIGAGGTESVLQEGARNFLKPVIDAKTVAENDLRARDLDWSILRPGQLPDGPATGNGLLSEDQTLMGKITQGELAALIVKALDDDATTGKVYHTIDSEMIGSFSSFD
jgi:nucleoside-diphosphate-sugar epimerase